MRYPALLAVAAIAVAGCGGGDEEGSNSNLAAAADGQRTVVFAIDCLQGFVPEPPSLVVTCADSGIQLKDVQWQAWGTPIASGAGTAVVNSCDPDCASGTVAEYAGTQVKLSAIKDCGSEYRYTSLELIYAGEIPPGSDSTLKESFPCT